MFTCVPTIVILSACYFVYLDAFDLTAVSSFVSPKVIKCYRCSSLMNDDCKNISNSLKNDELIEECMPGAQGCVKQWVETHDGRSATFRECYYGSISFFYKSLTCEGTNRNKLYDKVQCFKCGGSLCNNSERFRLHSTIKIFFATISLIFSSYILRM